MLRLWLMALFTPNVDRVLKNFNRTISKLEKARDFHNHRQAELGRTMAAMKKQQEFSDGEALRAEGIATKLKGLISL